MALEYQVNEEAYNGLDDVMKGHYEKHGDDYFLQATGMVPKVKLDEFRETNIQQRVDVEKAQETIDDLNAKLEIANQGADKDKINQLVEDGIGKRTQAMQEENDAALKAATERAVKSESSLKALVVSNAVSQAAIAAGVKDTALPDMISRAENTFRVVDGKAIPYDGEDPINGPDGKTPQTMTDWLAGQAVSAPHLFKESTGSDADNKNKGNGGGAAKTTSRAEFDSMSQTARSAFSLGGGTVTD